MTSLALILIPFAVGIAVGLWLTAKCEETHDPDQLNPR